MKTVVITRHPALIQFLVEKGIVEKGTPVIDHATPEQVKGKHVIGVLPLSLACLAETITEIPLNLTPEMRGKELDIETLRKISGDPITYKVTVI